MDMPLSECTFYHTIDVPGLGVQYGPWDYRNGADAYLGNVDFKDKTVLEIGPANGFFTFAMEDRGGKVTAIELGPTDEWDIVPGPQVNREAVLKIRREAVRRIENAFWFCHKARRSQEVVVHGTVYGAPELVRPHQIGVIASVLQHLRDPFLALERLSKVVTETIVVTDTLWTEDPGLLSNADMRLIPRAELPEVDHSWFQVSPILVREILRMLGFSHVRITTHKQPLKIGNESLREVPHFTCIGSKIST